MNSFGKMSRWLAGCISHLPQSAVRMKKKFIKIKLCYANLVATKRYLACEYLDTMPGMAAK